MLFCSFGICQRHTHTQTLILTLSVSPGHGVEPAAPLSGPQCWRIGWLGTVHPRFDHKPHGAPKDTPLPMPAAPGPASPFPLVRLVMAPIAALPFYHSLSDSHRMDPGWADGSRPGSKPRPGYALQSKGLDRGRKKMKAKKHLKHRGTFQTYTEGESGSAHLTQCFQTIFFCLRFPTHGRVRWAQLPLHQHYSSHFKCVHLNGL